MPVNVPALTWVAYQGASTGTMLATVNLDSANGNEFFVPTQGTYSNTVLYADTVIIFNQNNNGIVTVTAGPLQLAINAYDRDYIQLPGQAIQLLDVKFTVGVITLQFYKGQPPVNPSLTNYAGAQALSNNVVFPGSLTVGTNALTITVPTNFAYNNGVIVTGTISQTNTGAVTLDVNATSAKPINKFIGGGFGVPFSSPLSGGELLALSNFAVSFNASADAWDLIFPAMFEDSNVVLPLAATVAVPVAGAFVSTGLTFSPFNAGQHEFSCMVNYINNSAAALQATSRLFLTNSATELVRATTFFPAAAATALMPIILPSFATFLALGDTLDLQITDTNGGNVGGAVGPGRTYMTVKRLN